MTSVLITRPQIMAEALASALRSCGYEPVIEPLLSIIPAPGACPQDDTVEAVMITSGNALLAPGDIQNAGRFFDLPCFCVGARTAEKARAFGFRRVQSAASDGAELAALMGNAYAGKTASFLHIAGRDVDSKGRRDLEAQGHRVIVWPVYEARPVSALAPSTKTRLKRQKLDAVVVFSPRTARVFGDLLAGAALEACCADLAAICLSGAVAEILKPFSWRRLIAAPQPTEDAVIACLQTACPVKP